MNFITASHEIRDIDFIDDNQMVVHLTNGRALIIPLGRFPSIQNMDEADKRDYEVIDGCNLSFLALDEIFTIKELMGI